VYTSNITAEIAGRFIDDLARDEANELQVIKMKKG
jgi:hypothetical protein